LGPDCTIIGSFELNMMLKIVFYKIMKTHRLEGQGWSIFGPRRLAALSSHRVRRSNSPLWVGDFFGPRRRAALSSHRARRSHSPRRRAALSSYRVRRSNSPRRRTATYSTRKYLHAACFVARSEHVLRNMFKCPDCTHALLT